MCLTVLIWLIKIAAFVWVSGGIHLQPVHSLDCWMGEWSQEKNSYIFIYSYIYILNIIYCLLAFSTLFSSCPNNPISKSRKAGRNILHLIVLYSRTKNVSNIAREISTYSSWFESRKLWTQHMTALESRWLVD